MSALKTNLIITITLIVGLLIKCGNSAEDFKENSDDSTFIVHLSNSDILKGDLMSDINAKLDQRLQESLEMQREQLQQNQDIIAGSVQRMENQNAAFRDNLKQDVTAIMNQKIAELQKNITSIMGQRIEIQLETLRREIKQLFENQQQINHQHLKSIIHTSISSPCESKKSCAEALKYLGDNSSGIHQLNLPDFNLKPFDAYCLQDSNNGSAWTIIQRRHDNSTDFDRDWNEYKQGFGDLSSNFFIGLEKIHAMTKAQPHELWIHLEDFEGEKRFAKYERFAIGNEHDKYALNILDKFSGNAGDSLTEHKGYQFSTKDNDNDDSFYYNCAQHYSGAWWYIDCWSNLNGLYLNRKSYAQSGIAWHHWHGVKYSLKYLHMAIRPIK